MILGAIPVLSSVTFIGAAGFNLYQERSSGEGVVSTQVMYTIGALIAVIVVLFGMPILLGLFQHRLRGVRRREHRDRAVGGDAAVRFDHIDRVRDESHPGGAVVDDRIRLPGFQAHQGKRNDGPDVGRCGTFGR